MKLTLRLMLWMCLPLSVLAGCGGQRVIFVSESDGLVRLGDDVQGHVYVWNGSSWALSKNKVRLPAGWYAGSIDGNDPEITESKPTAVDN